MTFNFGEKREKINYGYDKLKRFLFWLVTTLVLACIVFYVIYRITEKPYQKVVKQAIKEMQIDSATAMYHGYEMKQMIRKGVESERD